jgi:hypothetical protein
MKNHHYHNLNTLFNLVDKSENNQSEIKNYEIKNFPLLIPNKKPENNNKFEISENNIINNINTIVREEKQIEDKDIPFSLLEDRLYNEENIDFFSDIEKKDINLSLLGDILDNDEKDINLSLLEDILDNEENFNYIDKIIFGNEKEKN